MFVRLKRIKGKDYAYLVENSWTRKGARQKVAKYLGRVIKPESVKSESLADFLKIDDTKEYVKNTDTKEIISDLVKLELASHNLDIEIKFEDNEILDGKGKKIVLQINDGYLCSETLRQLIDYDSKKDARGVRLAELIVAAGLKIEPDVFISLFAKTRSQEDLEKVENLDFYY